MAPPWRFDLSIGRPSSFWTASHCAAKASLMSKICARSLVSFSAITARVQRATHVNVLDLEAGLLENTADAVNGTDACGAEQARQSRLLNERTVRLTHDGRLDGVDMVRDDPRKGLDPVPLDRLLTDDHVRGRTVTDTTRVAGGDGSVLGKDGRELGELFERDLRARVLVLLEDDRLSALLLRRETDGCDLALKGARVETCERDARQVASLQARRQNPQTSPASIAAGSAARTCHSLRE